ncbi:preprotein translocase subunit SecD [Sporosarcina luteola]|nr:preprotein translocase subunit SecD [Sporosarcina luteola]
MEKKETREQLHGLSSQLMELFVSDLLSKNKVDVKEAKQRLTADQKEQLKQTVEQLRAQVEGFLESKTVQKVSSAKDKTEEPTVNPLRQAVIEKKQKKVKKESEKHKKHR